MSLTKKLATLTLISFLIGCQTDLPINPVYKQENKTSLSSNTTATSSVTQTTSEKISSIYPINNRMGYYYVNGAVKIISFPKTILDKYTEGDYLIIKAR